MRLLQVAVRAAYQAGEAILDIHARNFEVEYKADESPLTEADKASHRIIVDFLQETPYPILSEESAVASFEERQTWDRYWLIDPIDGTKEFVHKSGEFTVNIALIENGAPIMGVALAPVKSTFYLGDEMGAFKAVQGENFDDVDELVTALEDRSALQRLQVTGQVHEPLKVVASRSHCNKKTLAFIAELEAVYGKAELVSSGSSIKMCMVAEGSADIYPRIAPSMEWDTGAAHAVVKAAGGRVFKFTPHIEANRYTIENKDIQDIEYNKEDILNPYFIVSGLHK